MYNHIAVMAQAVEQAVDMSTPNWSLLGIIFGIMAFIAILLLIPSKDVEALEDKEKKSRPALKIDDFKALDEKDDSENKSQKSLAEIKVAKRAVVSEEKSKEEMRELRKARRAAAQTEKAIQEREVKAAEISSEETDVDDAVPQKEEKTEERQEIVSQHENNEEKVEKSELKKEPENVADEAEISDLKPEPQILEMSKIVEAQELTDDNSTANSEADIQNSNEVMVDVTADAGDMFATLFGDEAAKEPISFDDILGGCASDVDDGTIFPTLGSALIPLNEIEKAADDKSEPVDALDELTRRLSDRAEKKTPL